MPATPHNGHRRGCRYAADMPSACMMTRLLTPSLRQAYDKLTPSVSFPLTSSSSSNVCRGTLNFNRSAADTGQLDFDVSKFWFGRTIRSRPRCQPQATLRARLCQSWCRQCHKRLLTPWLTPSLTPAYANLTPPGVCRAICTLRRTHCGNTL